MSHRRRLTAIVLLAAGLPVTGTRANDPDSGRPVRLAVPLTHSDWMLRSPRPEWGPAGVRQMLDRCRACGWDRVCWRVFDGGRATYPSRLLEPLHGFDADNYHRGRDSEALVRQLDAYDFGSFDAFAEAIRYGHSIGLEIHAWLTINEDDHGWGLTSRFTRENADARWVRRDGSAFRSQQSFAFEKVRAYKLALLDEVLAYKPDGILFDWIRTGDVRDNPQTDAEGVAIYGYEAPNIERCRQRHGLDPHALPNNDDRWVRVRAEPQTLFMREAHRHILAASPGRRLPVSALVQHPWGYRGGPTDTPYKDCLAGLLLDLQTWAAEGLVDEFIAAGYYRAGGDAEKAWRWLTEASGDKEKVGLFGWIGPPEQFTADVRLAERLGASTLLLWEADYIGLPPANEPLVRHMADYVRSRARSASRESP